MPLKLLIISCSFFVFLSACEGVKDTHVFSVDISDVAQWTVNDDQLSVTFTEAKTLDFCQFTKRNVGQNVEIYFGNILASAPRVNEAICGGRMSFYNLEKSGDIATFLSGGAVND